MPVARSPLSTISDEQFAKLRAMHAQASYRSDKCAVVSGDPAREESRFHNEPLRMLLRVMCRMSSCDTAVFIGVGWIGCRRSMAGLGGS